MLTIFGIGISAPWILAALALLPLIYLLLRLLPTRPTVVNFPPTRLLLDLKKQEETPVRSPWWQILMRLLAAAAIIFALAEAIWRPLAENLIRPGPVWVVVDNSWAAASDWPERADRLAGIVEAAETSERPVLLISTADAPGQTSGPVSPSQALQRAQAVTPRPWTGQRMAFEELLRTNAQEAQPARIHWLTDGLEGPDGAAFSALLDELAPDAEVVLYRGLEGPPVSLKAAENQAEAINVGLARSSAAAEASSHVVRALDLRGNLIGEVEAAFEPGALSASADLALPLELRNEVARLEIAGARSAGAVFLVDEQWQRRRIAVLAGTSTDEAQPLLSSAYYLRRAVSPFATLLEPRTPDFAQSVDQMIKEGASLLLLADVASIADEPAQQLTEWIGNGGIVVRFALSGLDQARDGLLPVRLRSGARDLGGTLTWTEPQSVGAFSEDGPFGGLRVPEDVTVTRQVLAQPGPGLVEKTWAQLNDGTPLVTAERLGAGWLVLFHVPADTSWSNLPLSGVFVEMLNRIVQMSRAAGVNADAATTSQNGERAETLPPLRLLDGFGQFGGQHPDAEPLPIDEPSGAAATREHPPGLYGTDAGFRAVNVHQADTEIAELNVDALADRATILGFEPSSERLLAPILFLIALLILLADGVIVVMMAGGLRFGRFATPVLLVLGAGLAFGADDAWAQGDRTAVYAVAETRLAYVLTGNAEIDRVSERGLYGLSQFLALKTALEPGDPVGVDIASDELVFYPLLYWPIDPAMPQPDADTIARVDTYMRTGGTILFDTRDSLEGIGFAETGSPAGDWLREMLRTVDVPPLEPVPLDHVLTKTFYLLTDFPGRYPDGLMWIEALEAAAAEGRPVRTSDGVSPILITGNDMAAAWAIDDERRPIFPTIPNDTFQREMAYRVGVNIVMYTLTGNYKADQVHVPALLERLGQ